MIQVRYCRIQYRSGGADSISVPSLLSMSKNDESVKVVVRIRPMSAEEERNGNLM